MQDQQDSPESSKPAHNNSNPQVSTPISAEALSAEKLVIFPSRDGEEGDYWTRGHGNVRIPDGWEFLRTGSTFVTRQVKKGPHWVLMDSWSKNRRYTPVQGVYAPSEAIRAARAAEEATKQKREEARRKAEPRRQRAEDRYRQEFEQACLTFLDFAPEHQELAKQIAAQTAAHACQKHSGRVGRTGLLSLESKAAKAVLAHIRHNHTDYESELPMGDEYEDKELYKMVKSQAYGRANEFLEEHRSKGSPK